MTTPVVLVVEDEPSVQGTLCTFLHDHGFRTLQAENVETALTTLGRARVDAVLLDLRSPDPKGMQRSGLELLAYLRCTPDYEALPILIFTGKARTDEDEARIRRYGVYVCYKPAPYSVLVEYLHQMTGREIMLGLYDPRR